MQEMGFKRDSVWHLMSRLFSCFNILLLDLKYLKYFIHLGSDVLMSMAFDYRRIDDHLHFNF